MKTTSLFFLALIMLIGIGSCDTKKAGLGGVPTKVTPLEDGTYAINYSACHPKSGECYTYTYVTSESKAATTITSKLLNHQIDSIYTLANTDEVHGFYQGKQIF